MDEQRTALRSLADIRSKPSTQEGAFGQSKHTQTVYGQQRTRFSTLQRYALQKAFNESHYLTPHTKQMLQEIGIPKRTSKVWFKNRRVKWRKDTCEWPFMKKTPVSGHLHDNFSQALLSTDLRSLHSKVQNLQEPSLMTSGRSTMSHTANGDGLDGYSEEGMSGAASSLLIYSSFCQSQFHLPNKVPVVFNDLGAVSQTQHAAHSKVSWMDTLIDLQADLYLFPEGDQELPKLQEEQVHSQLDQLDGSQSTAPWLVTAGHMSNTNQTKDLGDTSQMNQSFVPQPSSPRIATTGHMSDTTQKRDLGCTRQMYRSCGPPSTSPSEIATTGNVSDAHSKLVLGATSQIPLRDWEVEAHLDDLMEIIAKEGFIASPELNSVR